MAKNRFHKVDEMFDMVIWTPREEKLFVNLVVELKNNGHILQNACHAYAFTEIASRLSTEVGKTFAVQKVVKKFNGLSNRYDLWEAVLNWPGMHLNGREDKFVADASTWDALLKVHPNAKKYTSDPESLWVEMDIIFGQFKRNEDLKRSFEYLRSLNFDNTIPKNARMGSEDLEEDTSVKDAHSVVGRVRHVLPLSANSVYDPLFGIGQIRTGTSALGGKMDRFEDDYSSTNSNFSSTGSCMEP